MPTQVQFRRGTTTQNESFTGAVGELSVDTTLDTVRVHDGSTAGGIRLAKYSEIQAGDITAVVAGTGLSGGATSGSATVNLSHLGLESLSDPNADEIIFWDDSAGATAFLDLGTGLSISGTTISVGTLNQDTTGTADLITASANNSTDETVYPTFVDGATGSQGIETDTGFTYNPSDGDLTIGGALVSATLDISGNADIDGTLEADAYTVDGTALNEYIADTVGAMVSSNTESGITVAYEDGDNTLDFTVGTLNQDTTGNAATATALETARTIGGTSFDGTANIAVALAATATTLATARTINGVSFDGSANVTTLTAGTGVGVSGTAVSIGQAVATTDDVTFADVAATGNVTITGNLDVNGTTTTLDTTNSTIADRLIELGTGTSGTPANDMGLVLERGSSDNVLIGWDESSDNVVIGTGSFTGASTGNLTYTAANFTAGIGTFSSLDISGNADVDGTMEADAYTVDGTALNEYIADTVGAMVSSNTESGITVAYEDGDNTIDFTVGTLNQDTTGTADLITATANNSTDETVYPTFVDGATGSQGIETDTGLTYNPSSGLLTTTTVAAALTGNASTASALATARTLSFTGDVTGTGDFDGSGNLATALTIAANSVALGTDTTGNYMAQVAGGDGITISHSQGEGSTATITGTAIYNASGTKLN
jgi:cytoskeletal protein CcmA (bactofilin family)